MSAPRKTQDTIIIGIKCVSDAASPKVASGMQLTFVGICVGNLVGMVVGASVGIPAKCTHSWFRVYSLGKSSIKSEIYMHDLDYALHLGHIATTYQSSMT